jgi:two-component system, NarL family, nitrate/nitrite response regulator NarL
MTRPRTALLAHTQPAFRAGLAAALDCVGIAVVAEAATRAQAVAAAQATCPGVCVVDATLPGGAIAAIKRIAERVRETRIVVLGPERDSETLLAAVRAGASGYVPRSTTAPGLARAVDAVLLGSTAIPRASVGALVDEVRRPGWRRTSVGGAGVSLTRREEAVVELLRAGHSTREIAEELGLSPVTVRRHLNSVAGKIGVRGRDDLLRALHAA